VPTMNDLGNVTAACAGCGGALSTYEWAPFQQVAVVRNGNTTRPTTYRLYRCNGCGRGAMAEIAQHGNNFPSGATLTQFYPSEKPSLALPPSVPDGISAEFREAETCMGVGCYRAAAGMFRSVLDKTMRANGYKLKNGTTLEQQIDLAGSDGAITQSRRLRAHDEIRVLGNDVLHDEWHPIDPADVLAAHHYAQRILEDFYDDRASVLKLLLAKGRTPDDAPPSPAQQP